MYEFVLSKGMGWIGVDFVSDSLGLTVFIRPDTDLGARDCNEALKRAQGLSEAEAMRIASGEATLEVGCLIENANNTYYFTFGNTYTQPFEGGWVEVVSEDKKKAIDIFNSVFPSRPPNSIINCSMIYDSVQFKDTVMYRTGSNLGKKCHARLYQLSDGYIRYKGVYSCAGSTGQYRLSGFIDRIMEVKK